jgi:phosphorylcholine metabolism protein LicD
MRIDIEQIIKKHDQERYNSIDMDIVSLACAVNQLTLDGIIKEKAIQIKEHSKELEKAIADLTTLLNKLN